MLWIGALLLLLACGVPFVLWGNPYPEGLFSYWMVGAAMLSAIGLLSLASPRTTARLATFLADHASIPTPRLYGVGFGVLATLLCLVFSFYAFGASASTPDEIAQYWHAKILLHGRLSLPVDPNREFFGLETIVDVGRWYSQFPIGGPAVMVIGAVFGTPWIVNPLLIGISTVVFCDFAHAAFGTLEARAMTALFALCPMILFMGGTWMNHVPVLCLMTCALALLTRWGAARPGSPRAFGLASGIGLVMAAMATIRPLDAVAVAIVIGGFELAPAFREPRRRFELAVQILSGAVGSLPLLIANRLTTGSALRFGYDVMWGTGHRVGFHTDPHGLAHTPAHALVFAMTYVSELNYYLMAWPVPTMLVIVAGLLLLRPASKWDILALGLFAGQLAAYSAYWGEGEFLGPRFLYTALPAIVILLVRSLAAIGTALPLRLRAGVAAAALFAVIGAWAIPSAFGVWGFARQAHNARQTLRIDPSRLAHRLGLHDAVIFIREPLATRLTRRLWGLGLNHADAAQLVESRRPCDLLLAIRAAEEKKDGSALGSEGDLCGAEAVTDQRIGFTAFGPALPSEPIDSVGRVNGDVVFVADLDEHNDVLRDRFKGKTWYRLGAKRDGQGRSIPVIAPY
jgi:hypothetical protein